jgi:hypothetical protein
MALALTSEQLALVHQGAEFVPEAWRTRYFAAVLDLLLPGSHSPSNRAVLEAISAARRAFALGDGPATAETSHACAKREPYRRRHTA